ncbi:hypothetical protein KR054_010011 [Drosophila jambulina]|nr:hypothetical protein KR054_010011 [Drosophila jambulina]
MMSPYLAKLKQLSHRRKMHNLSLSLGQHLTQLERLDRELALARQQEAEFYRKFDLENASENEPENDPETEEELEMEPEAELEPEAEVEEMEGPSSDTSSSSSSSNSSSGDQQEQGHGPGIGIDHLEFEQVQVQVHCGDDPAPGESGDCLAVSSEPVIKRLTVDLKDLEEKKKQPEQPLLTEVPSPLECQDLKFPMPSAAAIKLASKSKLNAQAAAYEMKSVSKPEPSPSLDPVQDNDASHLFRLNAKAPVFKPSNESLGDSSSQDLPLSGTIAAAAAGAEATYQLLMRQMNLLHQAPDPLAHIHPLRPYNHPEPLAALLPHPRAQMMQHPRAQLMPHRRGHLLPTPQVHQVNLQPNHGFPRAGSQNSLLGIPPEQQQIQHQLHRTSSRQQLRSCRKEPLPDLFPIVLTLMGELLRPVSYPEIVTILAARLRRPVVELKRHIPHTLHAAVIHGYMSKEGNRYSLLSEAEHTAIKRRNHEAAQRAKELEKEPLSWRKR